MMQKRRSKQAYRKGIDGIDPLDHRAIAEGQAIKRLLAMVPSVRVVHDSILWNKRAGRKDVRRMYEQTTFARLMFSRFFSRQTPRGRKYRDALRSMVLQTRGR
jgi:hypothetical protein